MPATEYANYEKSVSAFFESEGINCLTTAGEPDEFSWNPCDCCGSVLGGERYTASGYNPTTREVQSDYVICVDCAYYSEYGQLDDTTMMDVMED